MIQVIRVDEIPLGPLEDIQAIVMQYTDRLGYVLELTKEHQQSGTLQREGPATSVKARSRLVGDWSEWEAVDGD